MPHLTVEYTANLDRTLNVPELIDTLHTVAGAIEALPLAGLRTRALRIEHFRFADGHPDNAWVNMVLRIAHGRTQEVKQAAGERLFTALCEYLAPIGDNAPLAISFEIQEMDAVLNYKHGNIRDYMARRAL